MLDRSLLEMLIAVLVQEKALRSIHNVITARLLDKKEVLRILYKRETTNDSDF
jgi:hypothetical protein